MAQSHHFHISQQPPFMLVLCKVMHFIVYQVLSLSYVRLLTRRSAREVLSAEVPNCDSKL